MSAGVRRRFARRCEVKGLFPIFIAGFVLAGCTTLPERATRLPPGTASVELEGTPFFSQARFQCGPAALATVLADSGVDIELENLTRRVYLPGRKGSLQLEMLSAARAAERLPFVIEPTFQSLLRELHQGRPVVVLQNLGTKFFERWHYAVVVGVEREAQRIVLRSGTDRRRVTATATFLRTWYRSDFWAFVVLKPGELPADDDPLRFFEALAAMEEVGNIEFAAQGWRAALARWPGHRVALFGLANAELAEGRFSAAEDAYRRLLETDAPSIFIRNNLAYALAGQGRVGEAVSELNQALALAGDSESLRQRLEDSLIEIIGEGDPDRAAE